MDRFSLRSHVILWKAGKEQEGQRDRDGLTKCFFFFLSGQDPPNVLFLLSICLPVIITSSLSVMIYFVCKCVAVRAVSGTLG